MYCQYCGSKVEDGAQKCEGCGKSIVAESKISKTVLPKKLTKNQKAIVSAIGAYEKKIKQKLGDKDAILNKYKNMIQNAQKSASKQEIEKIRRQKLIKRFGNLTVPGKVPFRVSPKVISDIRDGKNKKLKLLKKKDGLHLCTEDNKVLATSSTDTFGGHSLSDKSEQETSFDTSVPATPATVRSRVTVNEGDVLYEVNCSEEANNNHSADLDNLLSGMISANGDKNSLNLTERKLDNVAWHEFSYYEYIYKPEILKPDTNLELSRGVMDMLYSLDNPSLEIVEFLEFVESIKLYICDRWVALGSNEIRQDYAVYAQYASEIAEYFLAALIQSGCLSKLCELYFSIPEDKRYKLFTKATGRRQIDLIDREARLEWQIAKDDTLRFQIAKDDTPKTQGANFVALGSQITVGGQLSLNYLIDTTGCWLTDENGLRIDFIWEPSSLVGPVTTQWCIAETQRLQVAWKEYLVDNDIRYEEITQQVSTAVAEYPFTVFQPNSCNLGLRLVYRQEWRPIGVQSGEVVRTIPLGPKQVEKVSTKIVRRSKVSETFESLKSVEVTTETSDTTKDSSEIVEETAKKNSWHAEAEASVSFGFSAKISGGKSGESEETSKNTNNYLSETVQKTAGKMRTETKVVVSTESESTFEQTTASEIYNPNDEIAVTYVYSKMQSQYEILTRLAEVNGVVFIAERVPLPYEVDDNWVKKYDWIIAKELLDDSFRDALTSISQDYPQDSLPDDVQGKISKTLDNSLGNGSFLEKLSGTATSVSIDSVDLSQEAQRGYRETQKEELERKRARALLEQKRQRLRQHIRENILHYCRAIWSQEDSEQRMLRYDKLNIYIPTVWKFRPTTGVDIVDFDELTNTILLDGHFIPDLSDLSTIRPVTEVINPAGPIGFAGNYAVFYMKPDAEIDAKCQHDLFDMLHLMRSAYYDPDTRDLIDPALQYIKDNEAIPDNIHREVREKMIDSVPEIRADYAKESSKDDFDSEIFLTDEERWEEYKMYYYEYLFREEYSRRFLVDTNNLMIDILVGSGIALEPFKQAHRYMDVLKVVEERNKLELENAKIYLENERRQKLLDANRLGDPDIDKIVVASDGKLAEELIAEEASETASTG
ncbi:zinc ribbon domain-containing protein [Chloroflexi bacterium CFX2]|nr:zinc ribbon domain-containing protein [Chloroflexi bacterium CFX2]